MLQNLVGQSAVDCCVEAVLHFDLLQRLYAFFVSSTYRWGVLMTHVREQTECLVPKHPSDTRWSARADASEAFYKGYHHQFQSALQEISLDATQNSSTRNEADALAKHMNTTEIALCELWNDILQRFNSGSKLL